MEKMETEIDFLPVEVDIVSTKLRTWNLKHPGNIFYTELVHKKVSGIKEIDDQAEIRRVAEEIVAILTIERGGRFIKLKEGDKIPTRCILMERKNCVSKVIHALRTAQSKLETRTTLGDSQPAGKKKKVNVVKLAKKKDKSLTPRSSRANLSTVFESIVYLAKQGNQPIHRYALKLISLVCNQSDPATAHRVLDNPSPEYTLESEPDKERLMRLQIRHRYASASAIGMTPLEFSRELLKLWGATLVEVKAEKATNISPQQSTQAEQAEGSQIGMQETTASESRLDTAQSEWVSSEAAQETTPSELRFEAAQSELVSSAAAQEKNPSELRLDTAQSEWVSSAAAQETTLSEPRLGAAQSELVPSEAAQETTPSEPRLEAAQSELVPAEAAQETTPSEPRLEAAQSELVSSEAALIDQNPLEMRWEQPISELSALGKAHSEPGASGRTGPFGSFGS